MPLFQGATSALKTLRAEVRGATEDIRSFSSSTKSLRDDMSATSQHAESFASSLVDTMERVQAEATPRIKDLEFDLQNSSDQGNLWATSLLDLIRQVQAGTVEADKVIHAFGDGMILFEGQMRSIKDVLADVLPTTGQVQAAIQDLREELENADVGELVDRLSGQYNEYAQLLAQTVEGFAAGQVTLERVLLLAQQLQEVMPNSETGALAEAIENALGGGRL